MEADSGAPGVGAVGARSSGYGPSKHGRVGLCYDGMASFLCDVEMRNVRSVSKIGLHRRPGDM